MTRLRIPIGLTVSAVLLAPANLALVSPREVRAQQASPVESAPMRLTLPAAIDLAMAHNHKLELAHLSVRDQEEQKRVAQSHFYPVIRNESGTLHITELEGVVLPAGVLSRGTSAGPIPAQTLRIDQGASTLYSSGTGLDQPLTQMFKIHAGVKAANADLKSAQIQAGDSENSIALEVHQLYYNYLIEQLRGSAAQDAVSAATTLEEENKQALLDGKLLKDAELSSRAKLLDQQRAVLESKLNLEDLTLQLDDVLGLPMGTKFILDADSVGDAPALPSQAEAIAEVLGKNPGVLAAQQGVKKAREGLAVAHDAYIPNITGVARYSYQSGLPFFVHNFGTFGATFTYDLFDGGAREAEVRDAKIKLSMAQAQLAQAENDARIQLSAAYDKAEELEQLLKVANLTLEVREESLRIESQRVDVQAELASGVASARADVTTAKVNVLEAKLGLYLTRNDVLKLLGERPR
jgi:outer membrane protein TolC